MYVPLPKLQDLLSDSRLQQECLEYVATQGLLKFLIGSLHDIVYTCTCVASAFLFSTGSTPSISDVFRLYCDLEAGLSVRDLCTRTDLGNMGVDERCVQLLLCGYLSLW